MSVFSAEQASQIVPPARVVDTVVLVGIESLAFAQIVPALARASQVVVLADEHSATGTAVSQLRQNLPVVRIRARPRPLDARVTAVLADHGYGRELEMLPAPSHGGTLRLVEVDARGSGASAATTRAEVAAVVEEAASVAEGSSIAVVCGGTEHADAVAAAVGADPRVRHRGVRAVALGDAAGLEADVVILSLGFAPGPDGTPPADLGILSSARGAGAARQAIVAALRDVVLVSALNLGDLAGAAAGAQDGHGLDLLADLLAVAGAPPLEPTEQGASDYLLADIAERLRATGVDVAVRFGVGGDVVPLVFGEGEEYSVAVVTDDALPAHGMSLRDQVRWQRARLESLGWEVVPLWTIDAFIDPAAATEDILRVTGRLVGEPQGTPGEAEADAPAGEPVFGEAVVGEPVVGEPVRGDDQEPLLPRRAVDDTDVGWGESAGNREDELRREIPPHW